MTGPADSARTLFDELAVQHLQQPGVCRGRLFGRDGLNVNGKWFAFLDRHRLVLKLPPAATDALIAAGEATTAEATSPTMRRWVSVPLPEPGADRWRELLAEAHSQAVSSAVRSST
jgi:hypothetical protein